MLLLQLILALAAGTAGSADPGGAGAAHGVIEGRVSIQRKDGSDKGDSSDAVVYVADVAAPVSGVRAEIRQHDKQFVPRVLAVAAGTTVVFPNDDPLEHNVFSHSANAEFDLGRFGPGPGKSRTFSDVGVAEIFCNVHKEMVAYVVVAPSAAFGVTGRDGQFQIRGVPPGRHRLIVWDRFARPRAQEILVDVPAAGPVHVELTVREQVDGDPAHKNKFGVDYPAGYH